MSDDRPVFLLLRDLVLADLFVRTVGRGTGHRETHHEVRRHEKHHIVDRVKPRDTAARAPRGKLCRKKCSYVRSFAHRF